MIREHWRDPRFWAWWFRETLSRPLRFLAVAIAIAVVLSGGFLGARSLSAFADPVAAEYDVITVEEVVTVEQPARVVTADGRVVVKPVRVLRRVTERGTTARLTQVVLGTVTASGRDRVVREAVPVTVAGRPRTVVETRPGATRTSVVTDRQTVTNERVVTNDRVVTNERVITTERVVTVGGQRVTVTRVVTETVPVTVRSTETVRVTTAVPVTVTQTQTQTQTQTKTETVTQTQTVPVTVTVTAPGKPPKP